MSTHHHDGTQHDRGTGGTFRRSRAGIAYTVLAAVALVFLFVEHRLHVLGALPYLLVLLCPLMHSFMHHGYGPSKSDRGDSTS